MKDVLLSLNEVAGLLSVHPGTIRNLVKRGDLPVVRVGSAMRFSTEAVRKYVEDNTERQGA